MDVKANKAIHELLDLADYNQLSIDIIKQWLFKYFNLFEEIHQNVRNLHLVTFQDDLTLRLPPLDTGSNQDTFLELFEAFETLVHLHSYEAYFKAQMIDYYTHERSGNKTSIDIWLTKNQVLATEKFSCFLLDYLDYFENPTALYVFIPSLNGLGLFIPTNEFKYTFSFLETFNRLYYT
jgi:hypothetical protein